MIVGTKIDLRNDKVSLLRLDRLQNQKPISVEDGYSYARNECVEFHECSAVDEVSKAFWNITVLITGQFVDLQIGINDIFTKIIKIYKNPPEPRKCGCTIS